MDKVLIQKADKNGITKKTQCIKDEFDEFKTYR